MEIDKIKRVALGQASKREQEEVNVWVEGSEERKRLLADAKLFYGREMPGEDEISDRVERMWKRRRVPVGKRLSMMWLLRVGVAACVITLFFGQRFIQFQHIFSFLFHRGMHIAVHCDIDR